MEYPKELMRKKELVGMGIPESYIDRAIAAPGQSFAVKINPLKKNSPYILNTKGFEEWRKKDAELQMNARKLSMSVM